MDSHSQNFLPRHRILTINHSTFGSNNFEGVVFLNHIAVCNNKKGGQDFRNSWEQMNIFDKEFEEQII